MNLFIDFESRSLVSLRDQGLYVYAQDPGTDIFCCAVKADDGPVKIWVAPAFRKWLPAACDLPQISTKEFTALLKAASKIHSFNAQFERVMYKEILEKRLGFPPLEFELWHCTAVKAAYFGLPRSLKEVCPALDLTESKDTEGIKIMMRMANQKNGKWNENPQDFIGLLKYCMQDVEAEYAIDQKLFDLPEIETQMYHLDQKINDRGIYIDLEAVNNLIWKVEEKERRLLLKVQELTSGQVNSPKQVQATIDWLKGQGLDLENLQRETVKTALQGPLSDAACGMLNLRQALSKSSVAKLGAMKRWACRDSRVRGSLQFYGAGTGRWAGRGIQPQNYPRDSFSAEQIEDILALSIQDVDKKYGDVMTAASRSLRGMITAAPGKKLLCADFTSIEARGLAWFAGDEKKIEAFAAGKDIYVLNAANIYGIPAEKITKEQRLIGKVAELALGYQGWLGAFESIAKVYGVKVPEDQAEDIIRKWRAANQRVVQFWNGINTAALAAVKTGEAYSYGRIKFGIRGRFLHCRLPSGRLLSYCDPAWAVTRTKYGVNKESVTFMGWDGPANKWCRQATYGGKLTAEIVQGTARDILRDALLRLESYGFNSILHSHDEIIAETDLDESLDLFINAMSQTPKWAEGFPITAAGYESRRYKK